MLPGDPQCLTVLLESEPTNPDPRVGTDLGSARLHQLVFNGLMKKDENGKLVPDLAASVNRLDATTYEFLLRDGVWFHDGSRLTSRDVKYTFDTVRSGDIVSQRKRAFESIRAIDTPDDRTVVFRLGQPDASLMANLVMGIVREREASGPQRSFRPVGTGPYELVSGLGGSEIELRAFARYHEGPPRIPAIRLRVVPDATVRCLELRKGTADLAVNNIPLDLVDVLAREKHLTILAAPGTNYQYVSFNLNDPILAVREVRWALCHAIDRDTLMRTLMRGFAAPARGILPPENEFFEPDVPDRPYDAELARRLLDGAGYPDPDGPGPRSRFTLQYKTTFDDAALARAQVIQQQFTAVGVDMNIRSYEWGTFYSDISRGKFQLFSLQWIGVSDPDIFEYAFHSSMIPYFDPARKRYILTGANRGGYRNPEIDRLVEECRRESDLAARKAICSRIQKTLAEDCPYINLWFSRNVAVCRNDVGGLVLSPSGDFRLLARCFKEAA